MTTPAKTFIVAISALITAQTAACSADKDSPAPSPSQSATSPEGSASSVDPVPSATPSPTEPATMLPGRFQPLWPFASLAEVQQWQRSYRAGGTAAWHLDAEQTALTFTRRFLGFTGIDQITSRTIKGADAHIGVGYPSEGGRNGTAAVIHLLRAGSGADAPWEVVGTDDTDFTLTTPAYGSRVSSPVKVGGRITGVDESIRIRVLRPSSESSLGTYCCLPAGGTRSPWSAKITFTGGGGRVLTFVAATGGHLADVERFAVTGARS